MSDPDWAKIISYLYHSKTGRVEAPICESDEIKDTHPFVEELSLSKKEAADALFQANEFGFLELKHYTGKIISPKDVDFDMFEPGSKELDNSLSEYALGLSNKGFDVAHEREQKKTQYKNNRNIVLLTLILASSALLQTMSEVFQLTGQKGDIMAFTTLVVILIIALYLAHLSVKEDEYF